MGFVRRWIEAVRHAPDPELRRAAILIRPHPQNAAQWADFDPSVFEAVGIWPRAGANPVDSDARADYYDSMFHSVAMVGINTSALIESGIVGRPVFTVLASRVRRAAGRHAALQAPQERQRRPAARRARRWRSISRSWRAPCAASTTRRSRARSSRRSSGRTDWTRQRAGKFVEVIEATAAAPRPTPVGAVAVVID